LARIGDLDSAIPLDDGEAAPADPDSEDSPYRAPEQRSPGELGPGVDLYALGTILFEMLTEELPEGRRHPSELRSGIPHPLDDLVSQLLDPDPTTRPKDTFGTSATLRDLLSPSASQADQLRHVIQGGESRQVEFKSSLLRPVPSEARATQGPPATSKTLTWEVAVTLAAFMNSDGGQLLLGVTDEGRCIGIEWDYDALPERDRNQDGWERRLLAAIRNSLGTDLGAWITVDFIAEDDERTVASVTARRNPQAQVWVKALDKNSDAEFYCRIGNTSQKLGGPDMVSYIRTRWPTK
jgi:serine/threonine protein kinase